jgi:hypothetical protein
MVFLPHHAFVKSVLHYLGWAILWVLVLPQVFLPHFYP